MRNTFAKTLTQIATTDKRVVLLSGDIGNRMFDGFKAVAPDRFFNCGIAEGCMMSTAAGMGLCGLRPVVYTITPFVTTRCLEQIKIGVAYHKSPVIIVGTGSGLSYSELGPTHHSLDEIGALRGIPELNIAAPIDALELEEQLRDALTKETPTYIRIGKKGEPAIHSSRSQLGVNKGNLLKDGKDFLVLGIGPIISEALVASQHLEDFGLSIAVASLGGVKPLDTDFLESMQNRYRTWISLEEHSILGGIGDALLDWISKSQNKNIALHKLGIKDAFIHSLGKQDYIRSQLGIDSAGLVRFIKALSDREV